MIAGIGIDIVEIIRIKKMDTRRLEALAAKVLAPTEQSEWSTIGHWRRKVEFLAGRFAAKEAVAKAFGTGIGKEMYFSDISVVKNQYGKPEIVLFGRAKETSERQKIRHIWVSITHSEQFAVAQAILEKKSTESND